MIISLLMLKTKVTTTANNHWNYWNLLCKILLEYLKNVAYDILIIYLISYLIKVKVIKKR